MDYAHALTISLQREITATETTHSSPFVLPEVLMDAISAWQAIKDNAIAYQVGRKIQDWIDGVSRPDAQQMALPERDV